MKMQQFLVESENVEHSSYFWNMTGSILTAFQSVIMLVILTRVTGLLEAGILTIAFTNANLFLTIGKYGMRSFQVSDVNEQFVFSEYLISRLFTVGAMVVISILYVIYAQYKNDYSLEKSVVIILMCIMKAVEAMEDIYHGLYQQRNRLDIAGKALTVRMIITLALFGIGIILLQNMMWTLVIVTICTIILFYVFTKLTYSFFQVNTEKANSKDVILLMRLCFPLFLCAFLVTYITSAPKYAIDAVLSDELQACYGFIAMPVFVIGLLNSFIFNPILHNMSVLWGEGKIKEYVKKVIRQVGIIILITIICIVGAFFCGIPVLSWLYNADLYPYRTELLVLLLGGGISALTSFMNVMNTVIRQQNLLLWGYIATSMLAYFFSKRIVREFEIFGAAILYVTLMMVLCVILSGLLVLGIMKELKAVHNRRDSSIRGI